MKTSNLLTPSLGPHATLRGYLWFNFVFVWALCMQSLPQALAQPASAQAPIQASDYPKLTPLGVKALDLAVKIHTQYAGVGVEELREMGGGNAEEKDGLLTVNILEEDGTRKKFTYGGTALQVETSFPDNSLHNVRLAKSSKDETWSLGECMLRTGVGEAVELRLYPGTHRLRTSFSFAKGAYVGVLGWDEKGRCLIDHEFKQPVDIFGMRDELARTLDWEQLQVLGFTTKDIMLSSPAYQALQGELKTHLKNIAGWAAILGDETPASLLALVPEGTMDTQVLGDFTAYTLPHTNGPHHEWKFFFMEEELLVAARRDSHEVPAGRSEFVLFFAEGSLSSARIKSRTTEGVWVLSFYPNVAPRAAFQITTDATPPMINGDALLWGPDGTLLLEKHASPPIAAEEFMKALDKALSEPQKAQMNWQFSQELETVLKQPPSK